MGVNILAIAEHFGDNFTACFDPNSGTLSMEQGDEHGVASITLSASTMWDYLDFLYRIRDIVDEAVHTALEERYEATTPAVEHIELPQVVLPVVMEDEGPLHANGQPFCGDAIHHCHHDTQWWWQYIGHPIIAGTLTLDEAARLFKGEQV